MTHQHMHDEVAAPGMMLPSMDAGNGAQKNLSLTFLMLRYHTSSYPDAAMIAAALCFLGPCKCVLNEESGASDDWILQYAVPNI